MRQNVVPLSNIYDKLAQIDVSQGYGRLRQKHSNVKWSQPQFFVSQTIPNS